MYISVYMGMCNSMCVYITSYILFLKKARKKPKILKG